MGVQKDPLPSITDGRVFRRWNDIRAFKRYWARVCELAKVQDLHFHDLRHTFTTWLQGLGVDYETHWLDRAGYFLPWPDANGGKGGGVVWDRMPGIRSFILITSLPSK